MGDLNVDISPKNKIHIVNDMEMASGTTFTYYNLATGGPNLPLYAYKIGRDGNNIIGLTDDGLELARSSTDVGAVFNALVADIPTTTTPTVIVFAAGEYPCLTTMTVGQRSNLNIIGQGPGVTSITMDASITTDTAILDCRGAASGSSRSLTGNISAGGRTFTLTTQDSTEFLAGDFILLRSNTGIDSEFPTTKIGEIHKISSVNTGTGTVTLEDRVNESYTTAASASIIKILMNQDITVVGISFKSAATTSTLSNGFLFFRFCFNLRVTDVNVKDAFFSAIHLSSCIFSKIDNCNVDNIAGTVGTPTVGYGVILHAATRSCVVEKSSFKRTRHAVTGGAQTGTNFEGLVLSCSVTDCVSETSNTSHYDTHQAMRYITYKNCHARGGVAFSGDGHPVHGFQCRSPKTSFVGCTISNMAGAGIYAFGNANHMGVVGCSFNDIKLTTSGTWGDAIYLESGMSFTNITANKMVDVQNHAVYGNSNNDNCVISSNTIINCASADGNVRFHDSDNCNVEANRFTSGANRPIQLTSSAFNWIITENNFTGMNNTAPSLLGSGHVVHNNIAYNPVGVVATPFSSAASGAVLRNIASQQAAPADNVTYTVMWSPKTVVVISGTVSGITVDGALTGLLTGTFKLDIGETINVRYTVAPTVTVYAV